MPKKNKIQQEQVTINDMKKKNAIYGWNPQQPTKLDGNDTKTLTIQTSCAILHFANYTYYILSTFTWPIHVESK